MSEEVRIPGTQADAKVRNPLLVVIFALITLGIYFFFWYFFVNRELRDVGRGAASEDCGTSPGTSVIAMTLGWMIIVPPFVSIYNSFKRLNAASEIRLGRDGFDAGLGLVLWVFISPVALYIFQMKMNEMLRSDPSASAGQIAVPAVEGAAPVSSEGLAETATEPPSADEPNR